MHVTIRKHHVKVVSAILDAFTLHHSMAGCIPILCKLQVHSTTMLYSSSGISPASSEWSAAAAFPPGTSSLPRTQRCVCQCIPRHQQLALSYSCSAKAALAQFWLLALFYPVHRVSLYADRPMAWWLSTNRRAACYGRGRHVRPLHKLPSQPPHPSLHPPPPHRMLPVLQLVTLATVPATALYALAGLLATPITVPLLIIVRGFTLLLFSPLVRASLLQLPPHARTHLHLTHPAPLCTPRSCSRTRSCC
jgi:hypothetical protein